MLKSDAEMWNFHARTALRLCQNTPELRRKKGSRDRKMLKSDVEMWNFLAITASKLRRNTPELRRKTRVQG